MKDLEKPVVRMRLWIETSEGIIFGSGRAELLERIERHGSLKKAAESLGMSYRAAWGKIKQTEAALGKKLIEKKASNREGYELTPLGKEVTRLFLEWMRYVEEDALKKAKEMFQFNCLSYSECKAAPAAKAMPAVKARKVKKQSLRKPHGWTKV